MTFKNLISKNKVNPYGKFIKTTALTKSNKTSYAEEQLEQYSSEVKQQK
jgi:hypothetical protein